MAALALVGLALLIYSASVYANQHSFYQYAQMDSTALKSVWLARYGVIPSMMLCALIPLAAAAVLGRQRPPERQETAARTAARMAVRVAALLLVLLLLVQFGPQETRRSHGPAWQPQITALQPVCARLPDQTLVTVKETLGWHVQIQCARIE